ncbi:Glycine cleavage system transcriptional repressor, partial [human gut metagenome]
FNITAATTDMTGDGVHNSRAIGTQRSDHQIMLRWQCQTGYSFKGWVVLKESIKKTCIQQSERFCLLAFNAITLIESTLPLKGAELDLLIVMKRTTAR